MTATQTHRERYTIRYVASVEELKEAFNILGAQFTPSLTHTDRRFTDLLHHSPQDRPLMLIVERDGRIIGGALGFGSTLRIIALRPEARGKGLGQRLLQTFEVGAMQRGVQMISLGAVEQAQSFYERMGYRGHSSMHKELPLPGRVLALRLKKWEGQLGDLREGQVLEVGESGRVSALF